MCDVCEGFEPLDLFYAVVPDMDVEAFIERWRSTDGRHGAALVVHQLHDETVEARFSVDYCPVCGERLVRE